MSHKKSSKTKHDHKSTDKPDDSKVIDRTGNNSYTDKSDIDSQNYSD